MESAESFKKKLYRSNAFQHVLSFYDTKQLLEFRTVSQKMADEIVPRCFPYLKFDCPEEDEDQEYTFHKLVRHAKKVEIKNICGTEAHLKKLQEIGSNQLGQAEYLYLEFDDDDNTSESDELARQYVEVFRNFFPSIKTLRIETIGDRNFTKMLKIMMEDTNFPWFESVHTIKCYQVRYLQDMNLIKLFFTKFRNLQTFKGITEEEFNPLDVFILEGKKVPAISWTLPEREDLRKQVYDFLQFNQTYDLKLYGGALDRVKVDTLHLENTKHLTLIDMPSFELESVFQQLPELKTFHVQNVEDFKKDNFAIVQGRLLTYKGLEKLGLELIPFDIDEVKEDFFQILRNHNTTLRHLMLGRNKISNAFMKEMCTEIKDMNVIETLDLTHLKEANKIEWRDYLESIALLSANRPGFPVRIILSDYQTRLKQKVFFDYLGTAKPNIEINYL